jgi:opacity protein-like surface antigen
VDFDGDDLSLSGLGLTLGGGLKYYFSPALALDAGLRYTFGQFTSIEFQGEREDLDDVSTMTARIDIGLAWFPQARR